MVGTPLGRSGIIDNLRGQTIKVPNLRRFFNDWPAGVNPHYRKMVPVVDRKLESAIPNKRKQAVFKQADFALVSASLWPRAGWEEYRVLTDLSIWLFLCDDEVDSPVGSLATDFEAAQLLRNETETFIKAALGFGHNAAKPKARNDLVESFQAIAEPLRKAYSKDQLMYFLEELTFTLSMSQIEHEYSLGAKIPTVSEYWACRRGTSGVGPFMAMVEFAVKCQLPQSIIKGPEMVVIRDETNTIFSILNDLLSLKKEVSTGCVIGLIPLSCVQNPNAQFAVDSAMKRLEVSVRRFRTAEAQLLRRTARDAKTQELIRSYISACKEYVTGNLDWSLRTPRYGISGDVRQDGSLSITL